MNCNEFRSSFHPEIEEPALLEHLRSCDACLDFAMHEDPDVMFRAIGGGELVPPGGVDAFVGDVMREVRLRSTEESMVVRREPVSWYKRLAAAAAIVMTIGVTTYYSIEKHPTSAPVPVIAAKPQLGTRHSALATQAPAVDSYDSAAATIVEMPSESSADTRVVMIFDDSLPADL